MHFVLQLLKIYLQLMVVGLHGVVMAPVPLLVEEGERQDREHAQIPTLLMVEQYVLEMLQSMEIVTHKPVLLLHLELTNR